MMEKRPPPPRAARTEELRKDIDEGKTGDKVPFRDPAAAPLGSDDEAAGHPPTPEAVALARENEIRTDAADHPNATEQGRDSFNAQKQSPWPGIAIGLAVIVIAGIAIAAIFGS
jgi:hypothetical protein